MGDSTNVDPRTKIALAAAVAFQPHFPVGFGANEWEGTKGGGRGRTQGPGQEHRSQRPASYIQKGEIERELPTPNQIPDKAYWFTSAPTKPRTQGRPVGMSKAKEAARPIMREGKSLGGSLPRGIIQFRQLCHRAESPPRAPPFTARIRAFHGPGRGPPH